MCHDISYYNSNLPVTIFRCHACTSAKFTIHHYDNEPHAMPTAIDLIAASHFTMVDKPEKQKNVHYRKITSVLFRSRFH